MNQRYYQTDPEFTIHRYSLKELSLILFRKKEIEPKRKNRIQEVKLTNKIVKIKQKQK